MYISNKQIISALEDLELFKNLTQLQKVALFNRCPHCETGYLHCIDNQDGKETFLWCNNCDLSMDSCGGYTV